MNCKFKPKMYKKDVFNVNYQLLKENSIKCLIFDLDNTLTGAYGELIDNRIIELIKTLKNEFTIYLVSNSMKYRVRKYASIFDLDYYSLSCKPFNRNYKKIKKFKYNEMAGIGDQMLTDVWGANRLGIYSVLVDPMTTGELFTTKLNRKIEKGLFKKYNMKKGEYYE